MRSWSSHRACAVGLATLASMVVASESSAQCGRAPPARGSWLVDTAISRLPSGPDLEMGAAGGAIVGSILEGVCTDASRAWLPATCAAGQGARSLQALRRSLLTDIVRLPAAGLAHGSSPRSAGAVRVAQAAGDALLSDASAEALASALACGAAPSDDVARASNVLSRSLPGVRTAGTPEERARAIERALVDEGVLAAEATLSASRRQSARALGAAIAELDARGVNEGAGAAAAIVRSMFAAAEASVALVRDVPAPPSEAWVNGLVAAADGDVEATVDAELRSLEASGVLAAAQREAIDEPARLAARVVQARGKDDIARIVRSELLGPWSDPWLFDANLVAPRLSDGDMALGGDLGLGYGAKSWGVFAHGLYETYDLDDGTTATQTDKASGGADGWLSLGGGALQFDVRGGGEVGLYDTTRIGGATQGAIFGDETSLIARGKLLVGLRWEPGARFAAGLWGGAGAQYESHDPLTVTRVGAPSVTLAETERTSLLLQGRLRAQVQVVPQYFALRLLTDFERHEITNDAWALTAGGGALRSGSSSESSAQIEVRARLFLDAEVARFFGFVPAVTTGLDYVQLDARSQTVSAVAPVIGAGIRRASE